MVFDDAGDDVGEGGEAREAGFRCPVRGDDTDRCRWSNWCCSRNTSLPSRSRQRNLCLLIYALAHRNEFMLQPFPLGEGLGELALKLDDSVMGDRLWRWLSACCRYMRHLRCERSSHIGGGGHWLRSAWCHGFLGFRKIRSLADDGRRAACGKRVGKRKSRGERRRDRFCGGMEQRPDPIKRTRGMAHGKDGTACGGSRWSGLWRAQHPRCGGAFHIGGGRWCRGVG